MSQAIFIGLRAADGLHVYKLAGQTNFKWDGESYGLAELVARKRGSPIRLRLDLRNHSPSGFECGYLGSGPAQLALAICTHIFGDDAALELYQGVKSELIARLPGERAWCVTETDVLRAVRQAAA